MFKWLFAFKSRLFLAGVVAAQSGELTALRNKLGQKDREITRTQADYRNCQSFYKQVTNNMHKQILERDAEIDTLKATAVNNVADEHDEDNEIAFTIPSGMIFKAELYKDDQRVSIDVYLINGKGEASPVTAVEYEYNTSSDFVTHPGVVRTIIYSANSERPSYIGTYDANEEDAFDLDPATEQDYIDQVMQEQADRAQIDDDPLPY